METTTPQLDIVRQADSVTALKEMMRGDVGENAAEYVWRQESLYFSELLEGQVRSENHFSYERGRIVCHDSKGRTVDWLDMASSGVRYAKARASEDKSLEPYIRIAEAEESECILQHSLISQPEQRTVVSFSLCGDDMLSGEALLSLGRLPAKKRGFVRVSVFDGLGNMKVISHSIDGLTLKDAAASYMKFGIPFDAGSDTADILQSPIVLNYADYGLIDELAPRQGIDTFKFVMEHQDLLSVHFESLQEIARRYDDIGRCALLSEQLRYDIVSSFKHRLEGTWQDYGNLGHSILVAGNAERAANTEYYGCDTRVGSRSLAGRLGYFNNAEGNTDCVTCGVCSKVINLPKKLFARGYSHCVECRSTLSKKHGRLLTKEETDILLGKQLKQESADKQETLGQWWKKISDEVRYKQKLQNQTQKKNG